MAPAVSLAPVVSAAVFDDSWADSLRGGVPPVPPDGGGPLVALARLPPDGSGRVLKPRASRERTPPPKSRTAFAIGDFVVIRGLALRAELNGNCGTIIGFGASDDRIAIKLVSSECIRVKEANIQLQGKGTSRASSS